MFLITRERRKLVSWFLDFLNQSAVYDEYTRHEEMAIFCVMTSPVSNKIKIYVPIRNRYIYLQ